MSDQPDDFTEADIRDELGEVLMEVAELRAENATLTARCEALEKPRPLSFHDLWEGGRGKQLASSPCEHDQGHSLVVWYDDLVDLKQELDAANVRCEALTAERKKAQLLADERADLMTQLAELSNTYLARCQHLEQAVKDLKPLEDSATAYLSLGGFFNPELMEHRKVSELLMDTRNALAALASLLPSKDETSDAERATFSAGYSQAIDDATRSRP